MSTDAIAAWVPSSILVGALVLSMGGLFALLKREAARIEVSLVTLQIEVRAIAKLLEGAATKAELAELSETVVKLRERVVAIDTRCEIMHARES